jgi:hypothetical protein
VAVRPSETLRAGWPPPGGAFIFTNVTHCRNLFPLFEKD